MATTYEYFTAQSWLDLNTPFKKIMFQSEALGDRQLFCLDDSCSVEAFCYFVLSHGQLRQTQPPAFYHVPDDVWRVVTQEDVAYFHNQATWANYTNELYGSFDTYSYGEDESWFWQDRGFDPVADPDQFNTIVRSVASALESAVGRRLYVETH